MYLNFLEVVSVIVYIFLFSECIVMNGNKLQFVTVTSFYLLFLQV